MRLGVVAVLVLTLGGCSDPEPGRNSEDAVESTVITEPPSDASSTTSPPSPGGLPVPVDIAQMVRDAPQDPSAAMADETRRQLGGGAGALPSDAVITIHERTWMPDPSGASGGLGITVASGGADEQDYLVLVIEEGEEWKILATFPVEDES